MKVTVCFGDVKVVVPCGDGTLTVNQLASKAVERFCKIKGIKTTLYNEAIQLNRLIVVPDGGVVDGDDLVCDVLDDREMLLADYSEVASLKSSLSNSVMTSSSASTEPITSSETSPPNDELTSTTTATVPPLPLPPPPPTLSSSSLTTEIHNNKKESSPQSLPPPHSSLLQSDDSSDPEQIASSLTLSHNMGAVGRGGGGGGGGGGGSILPDYYAASQKDIDWLMSGPGCLSPLPESEPEDASSRSSSRLSGQEYTMGIEQDGDDSGGYFFTYHTAASEYREITTMIPAAQIQHHHHSTTIHSKNSSSISPSPPPPPMTTATTATTTMTTTLKEGDCSRRNDNQPVSPQPPPPPLRSCLPSSQPMELTQIKDTNVVKPDIINNITNNNNNVNNTHATTTTTTIGDEKSWIYDNDSIAPTEDDDYPLLRTDYLLRPTNEEVNGTKNNDHSGMSIITTIGGGGGGASSSESSSTAPILPPPSQTSASVARWLEHHGTVVVAPVPTTVVSSSFPLASSSDINVPSITKPGPSPSSMSKLSHINPVFSSAYSSASNLAQPLWVNIDENIPPETKSSRGVKSIGSSAFTIPPLSGEETERAIVLSMTNVNIGENFGIKVRPFMMRVESNVGVGVEAGLEVYTVLPDGRAARETNLKEGDRILEINGVNLLGLGFEAAREVFTGALRQPEIRLLVLPVETENLTKKEGTSKKAADHHHRVDEEDDGVGGVGGGGSGGVDDDVTIGPEKLQLLAKLQEESNENFAGAGDEDNNNGGGGGGQTSGSNNLQSNEQNATKSSTTNFKKKPTPPLPPRRSPHTVLTRLYKAMKFHQGSPSPSTMSQKSSPEPTATTTTTTTTAAAGSSNQGRPTLSGILADPNDLYTPYQSDALESPTPRPTIYYRDNNTITMRISLTKAQSGFGFSLTSKENAVTGESQVFVKKILRDGPALNEGNMRSGDQLLKVDEIDLTWFDQHEVVSLLRKKPTGITSSFLISRTISASSTTPTPSSVLMPSSGESVMDTIDQLTTTDNESMLYSSPAEDLQEKKVYVEVMLALNLYGNKSSSYDDTGPPAPLILGISVKTLSKCREQNDQMVVYVKSLLKEGVALRDGQLKINDHLLAVNGQTLVGLDYNQALGKLKAAVKVSTERDNNDKGLLTIKVGRYIRMANDSHVVDSHRPLPLPLSKTSTTSASHSLTIAAEVHSNQSSLPSQPPPPPPPPPPEGSSRQHQSHIIHHSHPPTLPHSSLQHASVERDSPSRESQTSQATNTSSSSTTHNSSNSSGGIGGGGGVGGGGGMGLGSGGVVLGHGKPPAPVPPPPERTTSTSSTSTPLVNGAAASQPKPPLPARLQLGKRSVLYI